MSAHWWTDRWMDGNASKTVYPLVSLRSLGGYKKQLFGVQSGILGHPFHPCVLLLQSLWESVEWDFLWVRCPCHKGKVPMQWVVILNTFLFTNTGSSRDVGRVFVVSLCLFASLCPLTCSAWQARGMHWSWDKTVRITGWPLFWKPGNVREFYVSWKRSPWIQGFVVIKYTTSMGIHVTLIA